MQASSENFKYSGNLLYRHPLNTEIKVEEE